MHTVLFIGILFILQVFYYILGRMSSRSVEEDGDYYLSGGGVRFFPLMMTFLATQIGGGLVLGSCDEAYRMGWSVILYPLGAALGLIVLGLGIGKRLASFQVTTVAQILEEAYQSKGLKWIASILSIGSLWITFVAQLTASRSFLSTMGVDHLGIFVLFWFFVFYYTSRGGLRAVIATDVAQALFFLAIFSLCASFLVVDYPIPLQTGQLPPTEKMTGWFLMPLLFMLIEQDMGQRCFTGGSKKVVSRATMTAGLLMIGVCLIPVYIGVLARELQLIFPEGKSVLLGTVEALSNPWVTALVGCAIVAAIISTVSSLINAISSNVMNDFIQVKKVKVLQRTTFAFSIAAMFASLFFERVIDVMIFGYELSVSSLFVPIFMALFAKKKMEPIVGILSFLLGFGSFIYFIFFPSPWLPKEVMSLLLSFGGFVIGLVLAKRGVSLRQRRENS